MCHHARLALLILKNNLTVIPPSETSVGCFSQDNLKKEGQRLYNLTSSPVSQQAHIHCSSQLPYLFLIQ
jgi:hypothetical protein